MNLLPSFRITYIKILRIKGREVRTLAHAIVRARNLDEAYIDGRKFLEWSVNSGSIRGFEIKNVSVISVQEGSQRLTAKKRDYEG